MKNADLLDVWLWPEGKNARGWTPADTAVWPRQTPTTLLLQSIRQWLIASSASTPVRLHLTEDWPAEAQRTFCETIAASHGYEGWQVILDVPRTAAPPILPPRASVIVADLWPENERDDGREPRLFQRLLDELSDAKRWRGTEEVERNLASADLSQYSLLALIAHGSERHDAPPFRLASGREWALPPGLRLPPLVVLLACGNANHNLVAYGRRLRAAGAQTVLAPTGRLDARPADRLLRDFLHGWQDGQRVDELLWRAQQQPDSQYGAKRLVMLGRGDLRVGPARGPAEWADAELQRAAHALTPDSVPALQALLERLTWQCYLRDGDLEGAVDALYEALDLDYDDRDREPSLLKLLAEHSARWARLTRSWIEPYQIYLAEIYDHSHLPPGPAPRLPNADAPHACYHRAKGHYRRGAYPNAAAELVAGLRALPAARRPQRSGLGLLGLLVNTLIDLNLPEPAQAALDQLHLALSQASTASANRQSLNHWDRWARLAVRRGRPDIALEHYRQKWQRDGRNPERELAWLLYVAAWADLPDAPAYAADVRGKLNALYRPDFVFGCGNETPAYLLRALALWAWRGGDQEAATAAAPWTDRLAKQLGRVQDPGPFAMTLGYLHLYAQSSSHDTMTLPDWPYIAEALERERYWFELASLSSLLGRPDEETRRALEQFWALRRATGEKLAGLPEDLQQRLMSDWSTRLERRATAEQEAMLLAGQSPCIAAWVKQGMLPL